MADTTLAPTEYDRPPVYGRPVGGIVRLLDRIFRLGMTQADAIKPES